MKRFLIFFLGIIFVFFAEQVNANIFEFEWTGNVYQIMDGVGVPANFDGINVGDSFVATTIYNTSDFGTRVANTYSAPVGLQMNYLFSSGYPFHIGITGVSSGDYDQWNWLDLNDNPIFQANDLSSLSFTPPLPSSFDEMNGLILNNISNLLPSDGNSIIILSGIDIFNDRTITFYNQAYSITPVPEPATIILIGSGLIGLAGYGRKKFFKK